MYAVHELPKWTEIPRAVYLDCAKTPPWGLGKEPRFEPLLDEIRACIPVEGSRDWTKDIHVLVQKDDSISEHAHSEWTAIYYVDPGNPVCAIVIEGERVEPEPGQVIVLSPNTVHEVEKSKYESERISFAMLVEEK